MTSQNRICLKCVYRFYKYKGQCISVPDNCRDYNRETGECLKCYTGYRLGDGKCFDIDVGCDRVNAQGYCAKCKDGYALMKNKCQRIITVPAGGRVVVSAGADKK